MAEFQQAAPESKMCESVREKPKMQLRLQEVGDTRNGMPQAVSRASPEQ
jgi:hypothetical protein